MIVRTIVLAFTFLCHYAIGQINLLDSCGLDSSRQLNQYEIKIIDSLVFQPIKTRKRLHDPKNGFEFEGKKVAFFSCTKNSNTNGKGLMSKQEFFDLFRPRFFGHAGRGLIVFDDDERRRSNGFDAVIIIDCPYLNPTTKDIIIQLAATK